MDFVAWGESVLAAVQEKMRTDQQASIIGVQAEALVRTALPPVVAQHPDLWDLEERLAVHYTLQGLEAIGLVEQRSQRYYRMTQQGREHLKNPLPLWTMICARGLDDDHAVVLRAVNRVSIALTDEGAFLLKQVDHDQLFAELGWDNAGFERLYAAVSELKRMGMLWELGAAGRQIHARSTYLGAVWDMRQGETLEAAFIDQLLADGETTSVEWKREVHLDKADEKAEFVKDVLGLATTQVTGRRWLLIGIDDKTQVFFGPPGADITQNRIEQILNVYTTPQVQVRYTQGVSPHTKTCS